MHFTHSEILGTATLTDTPEGPIWKLIWKGQEMDDYGNLAFSADDYPAGTVIIVKRPLREPTVRPDSPCAASPATEPDPECDCAGEGGPEEVDGSAG